MNLEVLGEDLLAAVKTRLHNALHESAMFEAALMAEKRLTAAAVAEAEALKAEIAELKTKIPT
jgi:hypothetical protein